jgi:hypothetical protein
MCLHLRIASFVAGFLAGASLLCLPVHSAFAQTASKTNAAAISADPTNAIAVAQLEAMMQLQAQQKAMLDVLEMSRHEIAVSLALSASNNLVHLNAMSEMLARQRVQDLKMLRDSNRVVLAILVGLTGLLLLSILFLNMTSIRAINRLATVFQASALMPPPGDGVTSPPSPQMQLFPGEEDQRQLGSALGELQARIESLEHLAVGSQPGAARPAGEAVASHAPLPRGNAPA